MKRERKEKEKKMKKMEKEKELKRNCQMNILSNSLSLSLPLSLHFSLSYLDTLSFFSHQHGYPKTSSSKYHLTSSSISKVTVTTVTIFLLDHPQAKIYCHISNQ